MGKTDEKALALGINNYPYSKSLRGCINDASDVAAILERHHRKHHPVSTSKVT